jgi:hypothetical protein
MLCQAKIAKWRLQVAEDPGAPPPSLTHNETKAVYGRMSRAQPHFPQEVRDTVDTLPSSHLAKRKMLWAWLKDPTWTSGNLREVRQWKNTESTDTTGSFYSIKELTDKLSVGDLSSVLRSAPTIMEDGIVKYKYHLTSCASKQEETHERAISLRKDLEHLEEAQLTSAHMKRQQDAYLRVTDTSPVLALLERPARSSSSSANGGAAAACVDTLLKKEPAVDEAEGKRAPGKSDIRCIMKLQQAMIKTCADASWAMPLLEAEEDRPRQLSLASSVAKMQQKMEDAHRLIGRAKTVDELTDFVDTVTPLVDNMNAQVKLVGRMFKKVAVPRSSGSAKYDK